MRKGASALEYMTDYGWMIIIVAVVVVVLFRIGVFSSGNFDARIVMGSCMLYRPNGPGSISFIDLVGLCNNGIPKFVSAFGYTGHFLQVGYSNITVSKVRFEPALSNSNNKITITGWIYPGVPGPTETALAYGDFNHANPPFNGIYLNYNESGYCNSGLFEVVYTSYVCIYSSNLALNQWHFVAIEYNGVDAIGYDIAGGGNVVSASGPVNPFWIAPSNSLLIAVPWNGLMSNVQMYNTSLSENQVIAVYRDGLGGPPSDLRNLVGWWPLNGDFNDYSGDGNNGYPTNTAVDGGLWYSNYTIP